MRGNAEFLAVAQGQGNAEFLAVAQGQGNAEFLAVDLGTLNSLLAVLVHNILFDWSVMVDHLKGLVLAFTS